MTTHGTGTFTFKSWDETLYSEPEGGKKLTRASVTNTFQGDVEGDGTLEYLMIYQDTARAASSGWSRSSGRSGAAPVASCSSTAAPSRARRP